MVGSTTQLTVKGFAPACRLAPSPGAPDQAATEPAAQGVPEAVQTPTEMPGPPDATRSDSRSSRHNRQLNARRTRKPREIYEHGSEGSEGSEDSEHSEEVDTGEGDVVLSVPATAVCSSPTSPSTSSTS